MVTTQATISLDSEDMEFIRKYSEDADMPISIIFRKGAKEYIKRKQDESHTKSMTV